MPMRFGQGKGISYISLTSSWPWRPNALRPDDYPYATVEFVLNTQVGLKISKLLGQPSIENDKQSKAF